MVDPPFFFYTFSSQESANQDRCVVSMWWLIGHLFLFVSLGCRAQLSVGSARKRKSRGEREERTSSTQLSTKISKQRGSIAK